MKLLLLTLAAPVQAQFTFTTNNGALTVTGHNGAGGAVVIPDTTYGLPVTSVGNEAFNFNHTLSSVTIPDSITNIGISTFGNCSNLLAITVDAQNSFYSSVDGVLFDKTQTTLIQCPSGKVGTFTIPNNVTNIATFAFSNCDNLTGVVIPGNVNDIGGSAFIHCDSLRTVTLSNGVMNIGEYAFERCISLTNVTIPTSVTSIGTAAFFGCRALSIAAIPSSVTNMGSFAFSQCTALLAITVDSTNAAYCSVDGVLYNKSRTQIIQCPGGKVGNIIVPNSVTNIGPEAFYFCYALAGAFFEGAAPGVNPFFVSTGATNLTMYYLPGKTGWGVTLASRPTALWNPQVQTSGTNLGVRTNRFGFTITGTTNIPIVVEACTNFTIPAWFPLQTCTLTNGSFYFNDPQWTNSSVRFYRIRSP